MSSERRVFLTGTERRFADNEIIVSKTDPAGVITYANEVFQRMAGYDEGELLGKPHSIIRHPDMPRCVFKLLWDTIAAGQEIFAYVVNRARNGDHYWVFAHVTPNFSPSGKIIGYHSSRRSPDRGAVEAARGLYAALLAEEKRHGDPKAGLSASFNMFVDLLGQKGVGYDKFVLGL
ncbi:MAG: PAS domain-containing protein [Alphaproteobacteria bacterium]